MNKKWNYLCDTLERDDIRSISSRLRVSQIMAVIMLNRGITPQGCEKFLSDGDELLADPFLMTDMQRAVDKINTVISQGGKITVYGDYDVDGISSVSMLLRYLGSRGVCCEGYIPDREDEGYGLNCNAVQKIHDGGSSLIITVDNGITALDEVRFASSLGLDMVITDHHACTEIIPDAAAVVNPKRHDCNYPFPELSGAGVCFKLICALDGNTKKILDMYSEFVSLATIADVVTLTGENRALAKIGIKKMRNVDIPWFDALLSVSEIDKSTLNSYHIGFMIAPRINAAGRIGSAESALSLMLSESLEQALPFAQTLNSENTRRKELGNNIYEQAVQMIEERCCADKKVIVLAREDWHPGIIGITASRIADTYHKSVFLLSLADGIAKGSGRGIPGFNLYEALCACTPLLSKFGGHEMAAGLTLDAANVEQFCSCINEYADKTMSEDDMISTVDIDCRISCAGSLLSLADELQKLEPFGTGNPKPVFAVVNAKVSSCRTTRDNKHLLLRFIKNGREFSAIGFSMGSLTEEIHEGNTVNIAARLEKNEYMGRVTPQFHLLDVTTA